MAQKFVYLTGGREATLDDPEGVYTPQQIKDHWAATFPELRNASWEEKVEGEVKVITFAKEVGTKGNGAALEYARKICKEYQVEFDPSKLEGDEPAILVIAKKVLPADKLRQWLLDREAELKALRQELGVEPYDFHTKSINEELAKL